MRYPDLTSLARRRVLLTGAASGIGRATAIRLGKEGAALVLTDRDTGGLRTVADEIRATGGTVALARAADVTELDQVEALAAAAGAPMDVVMNIAGISAWGTVENLAHAQWRAMVEVNLMGPIHVTETFLPPMVAAGRGGWLVNVSSAAGLIGLPWHAAYSASKFGVRGMSEVLRFDLRQHGIGVSLVCPGGVATALTDTVEVAGVDKHHPAFQRLHRRFVDRAVSPEHVADAILRGLRRHRYLVFTSPDIHALHLLQRYLPPAYNGAMRAFNSAMTRAARPALVTR
jgi:NAD(P)-dependent dehydrogenase (short-subunit alcohol dehydrogenase family)